MNSTPKSGVNGPAKASVGKSAVKKFSSHEDGSIASGLVSTALTASAVKTSEIGTPSIAVKPLSSTTLITEERVQDYFSYEHDLIIIVHVI